jgi:hypothetical protein
MVPKYVENVGVNLNHSPQNCFSISETSEGNQNNSEKFLLTSNPSS